MNFVRKFRKRQFKQTVTYFLICCLLFNVPVSSVLADVVLTDVVNGNITVNSGGNTTNMTASNNSIGQFSDFDIAATQSVFCEQPGPDARAFFEVHSVDGTQIYGRFEATGIVYLGDDGGLLIGPGAVINMTQLVATGLGLSHEDFLNGRDIFAGGNGAVINQGEIFAEKVALIGKKVLNTGTITSPNGYVVMAAGDRVVLGQPGSNIVVELDSIDMPEPAAAGTVNIGDVVNEGTVDAQDGVIVLAAGDIFSKAINLGTLSASGGTVTAKAARVGQFGTVNVDGIEGAGGSVNLTASEVVALGSGSLTTANGGVNGDGGEVVVYSPDTALLGSGASIEVKGGAESGDGGFVEVSGKKHVEVNGTVDRTAVNGESGMLLIDPTNILITNEEVDDPTWTAHDFAPTVSGPGSKINIGTLEGHLVGGNTTISTTSDLEEAGNVTFDAHRDVENSTSHSLTVNADGDIRFKKNSGIDFTGGSGSVELNAGPGKAISVDADIKTGTGNVTLNSRVRALGSSSRKIDAGEGALTVNGNVTKFGAGKLILAGDSGINLSGDVTGMWTNNVILDGAVNANGIGDQTFDAKAGTLTAKSGITKTTSGSLLLKGHGGIDLDGTVDVEKGSLTIQHSFTAGGNLTAEYSVRLLDDGVFDGEADQLVEARNGTLTAESWLWKITPGNLELHGNTEAGTDAIDLQWSPQEWDYPNFAAGVYSGNLIIKAESGDIQVAGKLTTFTESSKLGFPFPVAAGAKTSGEPETGGVSVIAENGKIYTRDGVNDDTLNVTIEGYSDQTEGLGVGLPYDDTKKGAIVVMSSENLKLGPNSGLIAQGQYDSGNVDDRPAVGFLEESANIGGHDRNEGKQIDVAIYLASTGQDSTNNKGNAHVGAHEVYAASGGTMVVDAYDTVTLADLTTLQGYSVDRLEVCSRITEWPQEAIDNDRLPFATNPELMSILLGDEYVLRGAGLDNPAIEDGRGWVLEEAPAATEPAHLDAMASFEDRPPFEVADECPALTAWAAEELALEGDIETYLTGAYVYTTDLRPCEVCARLMDAATILADDDGAQIAALGRVISEFVTPLAPMSEEQMASISQALALHTGDETHYAAAGEWMDALVEYIGILNSEIGWSTADSVAFVTDKYVGPATADADATVVAFVETQLAALGG